MECEIVADYDFPTCGYIVDAIVQHINHPGLEWEEARKYFSGKHSIYCLKSQVIVTLHCLAVHIIKAVKGSVHDKTVFKESIDDFRQSVLIKAIKIANVLILSFPLKAHTSLSLSRIR